MEEIAAHKDHVWNSKGGAKYGLSAERAKSTKSPRDAKKTPAKSLSFDLTDFPKERLPAFIAPQLAVQAKSPPDQPGWLHEIKLDGYRIQAHKDGDKVRLLTRTGLDWTHRMKDIAAEIAKLQGEKAILDGEVVVLLPNGTTSFANLQASFREGERHVLTYFAFDLLHLDGHNLRGAEFIKRKEILSRLIAPIGGDKSIVRFSEDVDMDGSIVFAKACGLHAEGIISKRASAKYVSGRSSSWIKTKCSHEQEFVIGGFTLPSNGIHGVGALLLGYYDDHGRLIYAGRTGTGFTQKTHHSLRDRLEKMRVTKSAFADISPALRRGVIWVRPELVAEVGFATWTSDKLVRQAAFKALREDKSPMEVRREDAIDSPRTATHKTRSKTAAKVSSRDGETHGVSGSPEPAHAAVRLTHPDKILDSESGLTKQQLADYYWAIADYILPQITNRPLSLVRCPDGATKPCFFQKHTNSTLPPGIETIQVPDKKTGKPEPYITLSTRESLAALAQMGVLELHPWGSQNNNLEHPDRIVIDLDPDEAISWQTLAGAAKQTRTLLKKLGLDSFLKSTGGKGLHIVVPIAPEHDWATIKQYAHSVALALERQSPELYLTKMNKAARKGRIYIDYLRNERGATAVAAFSPRARAGASVSMPLDWSELDAKERPVFHVADFDTWKQRLKRDPWRKLPAINQSIDIEKAGKFL
jgi:bifunctional non-homologous end joining protein LigD